jgi:RNA-directed DNA polymerase
VLVLVGSYLEQEIMDGLQRWTPTSGTPQGAVLSPLLANLYLHPLDALLVAEGHKVVRYADDFVILCKSEAQAQSVLAKVQAWTEANGLSLHPDKTHIGNCREAGQGFEFLGYRFEAGCRWVRRKSLKALREKVRQKTKRTRGKSLEQTIAELNPTLTGWFEYFKHAHPWTFRRIDGFVRRRVRALLRRHKKRPGSGRSRADHERWPVAFFAERGLFTMHEAYVLASRPR